MKVAEEAACTLSYCICRGAINLGQRIMCEYHAKILLLPWEFESFLLSLFNLGSIFRVYPTTLKVGHGSLFAFAVLVHQVVGFQREHEISSFLVNSLEIAQEWSTKTGSHQLNQTFEANLFLLQSLLWLLVIVLLWLKGWDTKLKFSRVKTSYRTSLCRDKGMHRAGTSKECKGVGKFVHYRL